MYKYLILLFSLICLNFNVFADKKPNTLTWRELDFKCLNMSVQDKIKNKRICDKAKKIVDNSDMMKRYPFNSIRVFADYGFVDYESFDKQNNSRASIVSNADVRMSVFMVQHYYPKFKTYFGGKYNYISFNNSLNKKIKNQNLSLWGFQGGLNYRLLQRLSFDASLSYEDVYFIRSYDEDPNYLKFSKHLTPKVHLGLNYDVFSIGGLDFSIGGKFGYLFPFNAKNREEASGNFRVYGNINYGIEAIVRKDMKTYSLAGSLGYGESNLDTSISDGKTRETILGVKLAVPFGFNEDGK